MKYKDLFTASSGVFHVMQDVNPTLYAELFNDTDTATLDNFAYFVASEKTVFPLFTDETKHGLLQSIFVVHGDGWKRVAKALNADYNVTGATVTETTKGNDTTDQNGNVSDVGSNKGFNSADFVETDKTTTATDNTNARTYESEKTTTRADAPQKAIRAELDLRRTKNVLCTVLNDILNEITLLIYE